MGLLGIAAAPVQSAGVNRSAEASGLWRCLRYLYAVGWLAERRANRIRQRLRVTPRTSSYTYGIPSRDVGQDELPPS